MRNQDLIEACKELAAESFEWTKYRVAEKQKGNDYLSDEELQKLTARGAWEKYLRAGGDRAMINKQLSEEDDFGGQYNAMLKAAGMEARKK